MQLKVEKFYRIGKKKKKERDLELTVAPDYELLIVKFRLTLKKVGKTTRPFRYDLYQILYNYTVEVTSRSDR